MLGSRGDKGLGMVGSEVVGSSRWDLGMMGDLGGSLEVMDIRVARI